MMSRRTFLKVGGLSMATSGVVKSLFSKPRKTKLESMVQGVERLTQEDFAKRREEARQVMAKHDIDGLLLTGSTDLLYFTHVSWRTSERTFGAVFGRKREPIWVCPTFEQGRARESVPEDQEIRTWEEHESPFALIAGIMADLGVGSGRLALGPTVRSFVSYGLRQDAAQLSLVDGSVVTQACRSIKTDKEISYMELASKITKMALRETFSKVQEGMGDEDITTIASEAHHRLGLDGSGHPRIGRNSSFPHGSSVDRRLKRGDILLINGGCNVEGFWCDVDRTIVLGEPTDKQRQVWDAVRKAQNQAIEAVRPGVACEQIDAVARRAIEDAGFGPGYTYFQHRTGHGIGMDEHEYPYLVKGNKLELKPRMTCSCEPAVYIPGEFGIRIEDDFVVTEEGGRFLGGMLATAIDQPLGE